MRNLNRLEIYKLFVRDEIFNALTDEGINAERAYELSEVIVNRIILTKKESIKNEDR